MRCITMSDEMKITHSELSENTKGRLTLEEQIKLAEEILNNRDQLPTSISLDAQ